MKFDHEEINCNAMWDIIDNLPVGSKRYCCVCEGHNCEEALAERIRVGLPPPPADAWANGLVA